MAAPAAGRGHHRRNVRTGEGRCSGTKSPVWASSHNGKGLTFLCGPCSVGIPCLASDTLIFRHNDLVWALKRNKINQSGLFFLSPRPFRPETALPHFHLSRCPSVASHSPSTKARTSPTPVPGLLSLRYRLPPAPCLPLPGPTSSPGLLSRRAGQ